MRRLLVSAANNAGNTGLSQKRETLFIGLACFGAGSLLVLAMPPFGFWPVFFLSYSPLYFFHLRANKLYQSFAAGWFFGFGFFLFGLNWVANALLVEGNAYAWAWPLAAAGLPFALAFFPGVLCLAHKFLFRNNGFSFFLSFAVFLSMSEWLRGFLFTGFPWNLTAYGWYQALPVVQIVSLGGSYFLGLLTILLASLPVCLLTGGESKRFKVLAVLIAVSLSCSVYLYGYLRLQEKTATVKDHAILIVQPNIAQEKKWEIWRSFKILIETTAKAASEIDANHVTIIWPETAITNTMLANDRAVSELKYLLGRYGDRATLVTGILRRIEDSEKNVRHYNSIQAFDNNLDTLWTYDKSHLVPFGEYLPFEEWLDMTPLTGFSGFEAGTGKSVYNLDSLEVVPLVCYEVIFPGSVMPEDNNASDLIINVSNDAWYGNTSGPRQHWVKGMYRAVEEGVPFVRSANTGISGLFDSYGRKKAVIDYDNSGVVIVKYIPEALEKRSLFSRQENFLYFLSMIILTFIALAVRVFR